MRECIAQKEVETLEEAQVRFLACSLYKYCLAQNWAGYDPYDGLESELLRRTPLRNSPAMRLVWIQILKRSPINLRPLLGIPAREQSKGIALFLSSAIRLHRAGLIEKGVVGPLTDKLLSLRSPGVKPFCWGYDFDWQCRHGMVPRYDPNIICTTFAGNALLDAYEENGEERLLDASRGAVDFVLRELERTHDGDAFCFSYTRGGKSQVHNASLLGAALLARVWRHTGESELKDLSLRAVKYSVDRQAEDGSWVYGEHSTQGWIDSFHTGYNLLALREVNRSFGAEESWIGESISRGYRYYRDTFFLPGGIVKYYSDATYPIDTHAVGHAIITLAEFSEEDPDALARAGTIVDWARREMLSPKGYYYYQKRRGYKVRIPYMRWCQAWMLLGLASLAERLGENEEVLNVEP